METSSSDIAASFDARAPQYNGNDWHRLSAVRLVEVLRHPDRRARPRCGHRHGLRGPRGSTGNWCAGSGGRRRSIPRHVAGRRHASPWRWGRADSMGAGRRRPPRHLPIGQLRRRALLGGASLHARVGGTHRVAPRSSAPEALWHSVPCGPGFPWPDDSSGHAPRLTGFISLTRARRWVPRPPVMPSCSAPGSPRQRSWLTRCPLRRRTSAWLGTPIWGRRPTPPSARPRPSSWPA